MMLESTNSPAFFDGCVANYPADQAADPFPYVGFETHLGMRVTIVHIMVLNMERILCYYLRWKSIVSCELSNSR